MGLAGPKGALLGRGKPAALAVDGRLDTAIHSQLAFQEFANQGVLGAAKRLTQADDLEFLVRRAFLSQERCGPQWYPLAPNYVATPAAVC